MSTVTLPHLKRVAVDRPITTLCVVAIGATLALQTGLLLAGVDLFPGKLAELVLLTGAATLITFWIGGRGAVRRLFGGLTKWRIGAGRWALVLLAMPILTVGVAAATGTLHSPEHGWAGEALTYLVLFALIALTASLWEETTWSGFVQLRLMDRHGLLVGSMLTAIPFGLIHLPLGVRGGRVGRHDLVGGLRQLGVPARGAAVPALPHRCPAGRHRKAACSQQRCCTHPSTPPAPCPWCPTAGSTCRR